jgi:hypothetical protein
MRPIFDLRFAATAYRYHATGATVIMWSLAGWDGNLKLPRPRWAARAAVKVRRALSPTPSRCLGAALRAFNG